ncbi:hypothetical protein [Nostoc sp. UHCC 0252]|uniref:hypothetical protein n=1 Tax=Nostoc sp. UHCC 0252 TaxID=3110241 RepID=UPI002B1F5738|nr:hypothetical protein [Nostoc sp. UHCC 0252]MEA5606446.1 hypothetical protein [Nostoc sp. UHCC 0252]
MSIYKNGIQAFIQVLDSQSNLIPTQDWKKLQQLVNQLPEKEDDEGIVEILEKWLKLESCSQLLEVYKQNVQSFIAKYPIAPDETLGLGGSQSLTSANQPSQASKELLENAIKNNSRLSKNTKPDKK